MTTWIKPTGAVIREWAPQPVSFTTDGSPLAVIEPVTVAMVKSYLHLPASTSEDSEISMWITAARMYLERMTGRQIITATYEYALDCAPAWPVIQIPRPPLISVESVTCDDVAFTDYTVMRSGIYDGSPTSGVLDPFCERGAIKTSSSWPTTTGEAQAMKIRYVCGYGSTPEEVPTIIRKVICELVGSYRKNKESTSADPLHDVPHGAKVIFEELKRASLQTLVPRLA